MPIVPEVSAASCSRRDAVMDSRATSATTPPSPDGAAPPRNRQARSSRPQLRRKSRASADRPTCVSAGANRSCSRTHHSTLPRVRAVMPAANKRRRSAIDRAVPAAGDLVQGAERQTASRQTRVHLLDPERQRFAPDGGAASRRSTSPAQDFDGGRCTNPLPVVSE